MPHRQRIWRHGAPFAPALVALVMACGCHRADAPPAATPISGTPPSSSTAETPSKAEVPVVDEEAREIHDNVGGLPLGGITLVEPEKLARAVELTRAALAIRLTLPHPARSLDDDRRWQARGFRRWEQRWHLAAQAARTAALALRGTPHGDIASFALQAALDNDGIAQAASVPPPSAIKDDPQAIGFFRMHINAAFMANLMSSSINYGNCWLRASRQGPELAELAAACRTGFDRLQQGPP